MKLLYFFPLMIAFTSEPLFAANIESFNVAYVECGVGELDKINAAWGKDGLLTVSVNVYRFYGQEIDKSSKIYVIGDRIILVYGTFSTHDSGDPVPACTIPAQLTYVISGVSEGSYHFILVTRDKLMVIGTVLVVLLFGLGFIVYRLVMRRRSPSPFQL